MDAYKVEKQCEILLCSKRFFIVKILYLGGLQENFQRGTLVLGKRGYLCYSMVSKFDPLAMVVSKILVWF